MVGSTFASPYVRPCDRWYAGITGIWWKTYDPTNYVTITNTSPETDVSTSTHTANKFVGGNYDSGFIVNLGYRLTPLDSINASYLRFHPTDTSSYTFDDSNTTLTNVYNLSGVLPITGSSTAVSSSGHGKRKLSLDQVDLAVSHQLTPGRTLFVNIFGGVRYTRLNRTLISNITDVLLETVTTTTVSTETINEVGVNTVFSNYWGVGPLAGADATWLIWNGFGLNGQVDAALLVGNPSNNTTFTGVATIAGTTTPIRIVHTSAPNNLHFQTVPVLDAKLGAVYQNSFLSRFGVKVEAGYQAAHYFGIFNAGGDMGFAGPYGSATVSFG